MEKDKKIFVGIIVIISLIAVILGTYLIIKQKDIPQKDSNSQDALKFKEEYEVLNGEESSSKGNYYQALDIDEDNPIKYASINEIIDVLDKGTGIIYFGYPQCPWCRNAVSVLLEAAKDNNVETIYYLNMYEIRDTYSLENGSLIKTKEEQDGYTTILEKLNDYLSDYIITDDEGVEYPTGEKRLYVPTVVAIKDGSITGFHESTVELNKKQTPYDSLTDSQHDELYSKYNNLITSIEEAYCTSGEKC